jgi:RHS repeat-associated protein
MNVNRLTTGGQNVATDVKGNITTLPVNLRPAGATTAMNLTWDSDNKLRSADIDANGTADVNFQYDALGRRVARSGTGGSVVYVQMDQQTIADYPVGGAATTPTFRYVYASYIDEPVVRKTAGTGGTLVYFHRNHQYSITAVTTSTGIIAERYAYSAYGQPTILDASASVLSSSAINNRYTYTGREWDATLGLHHFRARWMSPSAGRFLSRDPIGYVDGVLVYAVIIGLENVDGSGTFSQTVAGVDGVDIVDVTTINDKKNDETCGGPKARSWTFRANRVLKDGQKPCKGYIVQKVTVGCKKSTCNKDGDCGANEQSESFSYFEAWYVGESASPPGELSYTDRATTSLPAAQSCGSYLQEGEVRFYCESVTGNLGKPRAPGIWTVGQSYGNNGLCSSTAAVLPSTRTTPSWWNEPLVNPVDPFEPPYDSSKYSTHRYLQVDWDCCCKNKKLRGANTHSSPDP